MVEVLPTRFARFVANDGTDRVTVTHGICQGFDENSRDAISTAVTISTGIKA